jgi:hypothetical protein
MDSKSKSITRSKQTSIKFADILAEGGITLLDPTLAIAYKGIKLLFEHGRNFYKERTDARIQDFHEKLLEDGGNEYSSQEILDKPISLDDYYALLSAAVQDNEELKIEFYANLLRSLVFQQVPQEYKFYLMKATKDLTFEEIELVRQIHIYENYELVPAQGPTEQLSSLLNTTSTLKKLMIDNLIRLGLLEKKDSQKYQPTDLLKLMAESVYKTSELQPESIGRKRWSRLEFIIFSNLEQEYSNLAIRVQTLLRDNQIRSQIFGYSILKKNPIFPFLEIGIIFLVTPGEIRENYPEEIERFLHKIGNRVKTLVKVIVPSSKSTVVEDAIPGINADETISLALDDDSGFQKLDNLIKRILMVK